MAYFEWSEDFSVGVTEIDRQHKQLIRLVNLLYEAKEKARNEGDFESVLAELKAMVVVIDELLDYSSYHFSTEEKYMAQYEYPDLDRHRERHARFIYRVQRYRRDFEDGKPLEPMEIIEFITGWWREHILGVDKEYAPFLNRHGLT